MTNENPLELKAQNPFTKKKKFEDPTVQAKTMQLTDKNELADPPHTLKNLLALLFVTIFFLIAFFGALYLQGRIFIQ